MKQKRKSQYTCFIVNISQLLVQSVLFIFKQLNQILQSIYQFYSNSYSKLDFKLIIVICKEFLTRQNQPFVKMNILYVCYATFFVYGIVFAILGPLVPFMAEETGLKQSQFTFIFTIRGIAYVIAGLAQKTMFNNYSIYQRQFYSCLFGGICFILFNIFYTNPFALSLIVFALNVFVCSIELLINAIIVENHKQNLKEVFSMSYAIYGIGSVAGPLLVSLLGMSTLSLSGILCILVSFLHFNVIQIKNEQQKKIQREGIQLLQVNLQQKQQVQQISSNQMSKNTEYMYYSLFFLYSSITLSYRIWLPSFATILEITSKQTAAISISIFSAFSTVFRFVFVYWSPDTQKSLVWLSFTSIGVLTVSLVLYELNLYMLMIFGSSILMGMIYSLFYPYLYSLPSKYGVKLGKENAFNAVIFYAIGEAGMCALIGQLMAWVHPLMLFISVFVMSVVNFILIKLTIKGLNNCQTEGKEQIILK